MAEPDLSEIDQEIERLTEELGHLRELVPSNSLEAEKKGVDVDIVEERLGELYVLRESVSKGMPDVPPQTTVKPAAGFQELSEEIASIGDELMGLEVRMLRAEAAGDSDEKVKLEMCASSLKSRRDSLIEQMKGPAEPEDDGSEDLRDKIRKLEVENRSLQNQIWNLRGEIAQMRVQVGMLLRKEE